MILYGRCNKYATVIPLIGFADGIMSAMTFLRRLLAYKYSTPIVLLVVAIWFSAWALSISVDPASSFGGPDEGLRYFIPKFIYENGTLPTGYDAATIHSMGNWSYAFYPQFLGPIFSAFFMSAVSLFDSSPDVLVYAARLTSVLFGVLAVYFVGKSAQKLFSTNKNAKVAGFSAMLLFASWPQVAFLSGYVNNDIIALSGVSVIIYACIAGLKDHWTSKNAFILAVGFTICLLSYSNSYGFVLFGGVFFLFSLYWQLGMGKRFLKVFGIVALGVVILAGPLFLRNAILYQGDMLGMAHFKERTQEWERATGLQAQQSYRDQTGEGLAGLVTDEAYRKTQTESFIARFGKMHVAPAEKYLNVYKYTILIGLAGILLGSGLWLRRRTLNRARTTHVANDVKGGAMLIACVTGACLTTVALSLYYSLSIDYQAQGRYVIYLLVPLMLAVVIGGYIILREVITKKYRLPLAMIVIGGYLVTSAILYYKYVYLAATGVIL